MKNFLSKTFSTSYIELFNDGVNIAFSVDEFFIVLKQKNAKLLGKAKDLVLSDAGDEISEFVLLRY